MGLSLAGISSLQQQSRQPLVVNATTVLIRSAVPHDSAMVTAVGPMTTGSITSVVKSGTIKWTRL